MEEAKRYFAFISYNHQDRKMADWLHRKLERYHLPARLRRSNTSLPRNIRPIFRDELELSGGVLPEEIRTALNRSRFLIVVCSPHSAASAYVNDEVQTFIDMGREKDIIPFITDGIPFAANPSDECFPSALRQLRENKELLGININDSGGRDAAAIKVVARMLGLSFDSLWQRFKREQRRRRNLLLAGISLLAAIFLTFGLFMQQANRKLNINQSRAVAEKAKQLVDTGDSYLARRLLVNVLPKNLRRPNRPYVAEAEQALRKALDSESAILETHEEALFATFSPDGKYIASATSDGSIRLWDSATGQVLNILNGHSEAVNFVSFSPNGQQIVSASSDSTLKTWDVATGKELLTLKGHSGAVRSALFSPDGHQIVSASADSSAKIWNSITGEALLTLRGHADKVLFAAFSPDGKQIVTSSADKTLKLWEAATGMEQSTLEGHLTAVNSALFSPDGRQIVSSSYDNTVRIWDSATGQLLRLLTGSSLFLRFASFSPDGKLIASSAMNRISVCNAQTGIEVAAYEEHSGSIINSVLFSPDGNRMVTASASGEIKIMDCRPQNAYASLEKEPPTDPQPATTSPNGKYVLDIDNHNIRILEATTRKVLQTLSGHAFEVTSASFSPDGRFVVSSSKDGTVKVWDRASGTELQTFTGNLLSASFAPDGRHIVAASYGKHLIIDFPPLQQLIDETRKRFRNHPLTPEERTKFYLEQ